MTTEKNYILSFINNIKKQIKSLYGDISLLEFENKINRFEDLKKKIPTFESSYINDITKHDFYELIKLSDEIKHIIIKSSTNPKQFRNIEQTCLFISNVVDSYSPEYLKLENKDRELLDLVKISCSQVKDSSLIKINLLPSSLSFLEMDTTQKENIEIHKEALEILSEISPLHISDEFKNYLLKDTTNYKTKDFFDNLHKTVFIRALQSLILEKMEEYKHVIYKNSWNITLFKETLATVFKKCSHIDVQSVEGSVFICGLTNDISSFIVKSNKPNIDNQGILHEFVIGSCLNQLRDDTPGFMFVFGAFFCSAFTDRIEELCSIQHNKAALSTIMVSEYIKGMSLKSFINSNEDELDLVLKQIFLTLKIGYKRLNFRHNDLHLGNVMIRVFNTTKEIEYREYEEQSVFIKTKYLPQLIDYGKSIIQINSLKEERKIYIKPFQNSSTFHNNHKMELNVEDFIMQHGGYPSYDWLRLLISLSPSLKNTNKLVKYITPYLNLKYNKDDTILKWFDQIKTNKKCTSFIPIIRFDTAYWFDIFDVKNYIHDIK
jgi:hypothetical protein